MRAYPNTSSQVSKPLKEGVIDATRKWLSDFVIEHNLCPFARRELANETIRFVESDASDIERLLGQLHQELMLLEQDATVETTLLIHPNVLSDFQDYLDFLDIANGLLIELDLEGIFQVASFHPDYQFADTKFSDPENLTNRSPYPMLHLLREASVEKAVASHPDPESIPERNIALMKQLFVEGKL